MMTTVLAAKLIASLFRRLYLARNAPLIPAMASASVERELEGIVGIVDRHVPLAGIGEYSVRHHSEKMKTPAGASASSQPLQEQDYCPLEQVAAIICTDAIVRV